ncbi:MAG: type II toxin-antitoxin system Phd/YefM family antitoxin [Bacteroidales bacterium]|nr:type II toxin-antitoxin system Phd/YefM family antitoxin [Bacteroidales bacterium]
MERINKNYIVTEKGEKKYVVLDISQYRRLLEKIEDLEDALDLEKSIKEAKSFRNYDEIREELKSKSKI